MTTLNVSRTGFTETFYDVENLIYSTVWKFYRNYGGDLEELKAEAYFHFVRAYHRWNGKTKFSTYVRFLVWHELLEFVRRRAIKAARVKDCFFEIRQAIAPIDDSKPGYLALMQSLSEDARTVATLAVQGPKNKVAAIKKLENTLSGFGWTTKQITSAFNEIRSALT